MRVEHVQPMGLLISNGQFACMRGVEIRNEIGDKAIIANNESELK